MLDLKPYTGAHAGNLHHVTGADNKVIRNASQLEVEYWQYAKGLERTLLAQQAHIDDITAESDELNSKINNWRRAYEKLQSKANRFGKEVMQATKGRKAEGSLMPGTLDAVVAMHEQINAMMDTRR